MNDQQNQSTKTECRWCGQHHGVRCPLVKAIEYETGGEVVKRVEFFAPNEYGPLTGLFAYTQTSPTIPRYPQTTMAGTRHAD